MKWKNRMVQEVFRYSIKSDNVNGVIREIIFLDLSKSEKNA